MYYSVMTYLFIFKNLLLFVTLWSAHVTTIPGTSLLTGLQYVYLITHSVVSGYRARLEIQGSRDQTLLKSMDFFKTEKS